MDESTRKKIDSVYRATQQLPIVAAIGVVIPLLFLLSVPLGLIYWSWRRQLLTAFDGGRLVIEAGPPPLPTPGKKPEPSLLTKMEVIRKSGFLVLVPVYVLIFLIVVIAGFVALMKYPASALSV